MNIIIGTLVLWTLKLLVVVPLVNYILARRFRQPAFAPMGESPGEADGDDSAVKELATTTYIQVDASVLGVAGLVGGLLGYWFIGFSLEARGWPGMIAFMVSSFVGVALRGQLGIS